MGNDSEPPGNSRRAVLRGATLGLGAAVAGAVLLPKVADAQPVNGTSLLVGEQAIKGIGQNYASATTGLGSTTTGVAFDVYAESGSAAVQGFSDGVSSTGVRGVGAAYGVSGRGATGVFGDSIQTSGVGVHGSAADTSSETYGVQGSSGSPQGRAVFGWNRVTGTNGGGTGVWGQAQGTLGVGVIGYGQENTSGQSGVGVMGVTGTGDPLAAFRRRGTGVAGLGDTYGVTGTAGGPQGVAGVMGEGSPIGVLGNGGNGTATGVRGESGLGVGVCAVSPQGLALKVEGRAKFQRSGLATIAKGRSYVDVTVPGGVRSNTMVVATLQSNRPGVFVSSASPLVSAGKVRIRLSRVASRTSITKVAWLALDMS